MPFAHTTVERDTRFCDKHGIMLFSILIPVFNTRKYLSSCLRSVESQSCKDYEVILVDDGSTDGSSAICDDYASAHPEAHVIHKENEGLLFARRDAIKAAKGRYLVHLDSDDQLRGNMLERCRDAINQYDPDIVSFDYARNEDFSVDHFHFRLESGFHPESRMPALRMLISSGKFITIWSKVVRRENVDTENDYSSYKGITLGEDWLQVLPLFDKASSLFHIQEPLYFYRPNQKSSTNIYKEAYVDDLAQLFEAVADYSRSWGVRYLKASSFAMQEHVFSLILMVHRSNLSRSEKTQRYANITWRILRPFELSCPPRLREAYGFLVSRAICRDWITVSELLLYAYDSARKLQQQSASVGK